MPEPDVYVIQGVEPEVGAYAMAKYSRSALSMRESLRELDGQRAEKFLNTFYFQYGHRSIADLAHLSFAIERCSILAAIEIADETRWDGQERSTRYQEFRRSSFITPQPPDEVPAGWDASIDALFTAYETVSARVAAYLETQYPRPEEMKPEAYHRTLRARAFDASRYLLPLATATSLGQIVSARTLEQQIVRLLSSTYAECRSLGAQLKAAASVPGAVPTLVKYTDPSPYLTNSRAALTQAASELLAGVAPDAGVRVDLVPPPVLEVEIAASLLYPHCHHAYRQIIAAIEALTAARRDEILDLAAANRGPHDELLRAYQAGQPFQFDILMDIGGFRDLHRHRRCVQLHQDYTPAHGYETPAEVPAAACADIYDTAMRTAAQATSPYALPLGYRKRSLFKMDFAQAVYIAELRTGTGGHTSYRSAAWDMYEALRRAHPALTQGLRVTPLTVTSPLQR